MARDKIQISGLSIDCIVGINKEERGREQPLVVDIELELDIQLAGHTGRIADTCNYDNVATHVTSLCRFRRYQLLEMAAEETAAMLLGIHPVESVSLSLFKPRALQGRARNVAVRVTRDRHDYPKQYEPTDFGQVDILLETAEAGLYLLHVDPGKSIPSHYHRVMRELEWVVGGKLERDGRSLHGAEPVVWPKNQVHTYKNVGGERATLFCCDSPPFIPSDEVRIDHAQANAAP